MTEFVHYLLKVFLCSGILFLYYLVALRNRKYHQWNRFYLLAAVAVSIVIPFVKLTITNEPGSTGGIQLLQVVESTSGYLEEISASNETGASGIQWLLLTYFGTAALLFALFFHSIMKVLILIRKHPGNRIGKIWFINTQISGTPFSFINHIFWNEAIDVQSTTGNQIFRHELVHVKEKHSLDKIFIELVVILFWVNPFFWLIKREIKNVHEFIADQKSVDGQDSSALAAMILQVTYPQFNSLVNPFFQTSIKRRLMMISKIHNPRFGNISRILALAIIVFTVLAFSVRTRTFTPLDKTFTVVIDAGHGYVAGKHSGAVSGVHNEDDINLNIANSIVAGNQNPNIRIVLTRSATTNLSLEERVAIAKQNTANLFLSVHVGASEDKNKNGIDIYVPSKQPFYQAQSELFGSALQRELSTIHTTASQLTKNGTGIYVVDKNVCPSVLIECGYITNSKDLDFVTNSANQKALAQKILAAIEKYAAAQQ